MFCIYRNILEPRGQVLLNKSAFVSNASEFLCGNFLTTEIIPFEDYNSLLKCASQLRTTTQEGMSVNIMALWINTEERF